MNDGLNKITTSSLLVLMTDLLVECAIPFQYQVSNVSSMRTEDITFITQDKKNKVTFTIVNSKEGFFTIEEIKQDETKTKK